MFKSTKCMQIINARATESLLEESLVSSTQDEYGDETKECQTQERLEDLERKLTRKLIITDNTADSCVSSSVVPSQATTTLPDADIQLQSALDLIACESQTITCRCNCNLNENENLQLREKVTDLEKKLKEMESMYMAKKLTLESLSRMKMRTEKPKYVEGLEEKYKRLEVDFINSKTFLEEQKASLEGSLLRLKKDMQQALAINVKLSDELQLSRNAVVVLTHKLALSESAIDSESCRNIALEHQINVASSELEILRQQLLYQREYEVKANEITNFSSQPESISQKLKTKAELSITEKHLVFQEIRKSQLEMKLQNIHNRLKIKLVKQSKTLSDLTFKCTSLTTYFRTLGKMSANGELLSRSDSDEVLNYLMTSSLLNEDIKVELNTENTIDKIRNDLTATKMTTSSIKGPSLRSESISKDDIGILVNDFQQVAINNKSDCGNAVELFTTKKEEEEIVVKRKLKQPDVINLDSESNTQSRNSVLKKHSCGEKKSLTDSSKNKRPYSSASSTSSQASKSKKRTPLQNIQRDSNYTSRHLSWHPNSALQKVCIERRWLNPEFVLIRDYGPPSNKKFIFKVVVNGEDYQPTIASPNKKHARAQAAMVCLQSLGLLPRNREDRA